MKSGQEVETLTRFQGKRRDLDYGNGNKAQMKTEEERMETEKKDKKPL